MYFESRTNKIFDATNLNINKQTEKIKNLEICNAIKIGNIIFVNDENSSGTGIKEVAALYENSNKFYQFESLTIDWMNDKEIQNCIKKYADTNYLIKEYNIESKKPTNLNDENQLNYFNCGCCGNFFKSTIKKQKIFDQDAGYGICSNCE